MLQNGLYYNLGAKDELKTDMQIYGRSSFQLSMPHLECKGELRVGSGQDYK
jgi:hypothetical protein